MELTPEIFTAILGVLRECGVDEFEGWGFRVRFRTHAEPSLPPVVEVPAPTNYAVKKPDGLWDNPALWPNGHRPDFPGSTK